MIPEELSLITELEETDYPSFTYSLDLVNKRINGNIDEQEAVLQAVKKILMTERYANVIYDLDYGVELESLIGHDYDYIVSELERRVTEALMVDDRITDVTNFEYTRGTDSVAISFDVVSIYATTTITKEVAI